jgi:hypothetical protein
VSSFASEAPESTRGFAAHEFPIGTIAAKLGVERKNQFPSLLHRPPITSLGRSGRAVDYGLVVVDFTMLKMVLDIDP